MANEREVAILIKAKDEASKTLKSVGDQASGMSKGLDIAKKAITAIGVAVTAAAAAVATFVATSFKSFVDLGDELNKMSIKTGVAVESLSRLKYAGDLSDVTMDQLATSLKKLNLNTASAIEGNKGMVDSFAKIGLSIDQVKQMNTEQIFIQISEAIRNTKDPVEQSAIAFELLGKQGQEMLPLLTSDIAATTAEAEKLGLVMSTQTAQAAEAFNDKLTKTKAAIGGVGQAIAADLFTVLDPLLTKVTDAAMRFNAWFTEMGGITGIKERVTTAIGDISLKIDEQTGLISKMREFYADIIKFFLENVKPAFDKLMESIQPYIPTLQKIAEIIGVVLVEAIKIFIDIVKGTLLGVMAMISAAAELLAGMLDVLRVAWDFVIDKFKTVIEWGQKVINMFNAIIKAAKEAAQWVGSKLGFGGGASSSSGGGASVSIGAFSSGGGATAFADGGIVTRPTLAMIGEAGESEAVIPLSKLGSIFGSQTMATPQNITLNINGGYYLDQRAAEDMGNLILAKLKNKFIL